jgi:DNA polymerase elongation subunit (family B)
MIEATQTPEAQPKDNDLIPVDQIQEYVNENIPILPLGLDGKQDVRNLFTKEEIDSLRSDSSILSEQEKKEVFYLEKDYKTGKDTPKMHYLLLLAKFIPKVFWTEERIKRQIWAGIAFLTGPTKIPSPSDPDNKMLWGIGVDADDDKTRYVVENLVNEKDLKSKTIVQTTPHKGMHVVFFVAVNPNSKEEVDRWRNRALSLRLCKDCKIEIKTTTMQLTLDPSKHRSDKTLGYTRISDGIKIWESDWFYDLLIERLVSQGCLKCTPEQYHANYQIEAEEDSKYLDEIANLKEEERKEFTESEMLKGIEIFLGEDEENKKENRPFESIFKRGTKHDVLMFWGAHCYFHNITLEHTKLFAQRLDNTSGDPDNPLKLEPIEEAYRRGKNRQPIRGKSGLIEAFSAACKNGPNQTLARRRLERLNAVLDLEGKRPKKRGSSSKDRNAPNQADVIVKLALENIPFCFKNQFKEYCAVVKVVTSSETHYEVMNMEDHNFSSALRYLWEQENIAQNRPLKTTVSQDHIKQARATLESKVDHSGVPRVKTHLRVAWKEENRVIRYDLGNDRWQQIEISGSEDSKSGVKIIDSDSMIKEIEDWKKSKFDPTKTPVLFRRYDSNDSQALPDMNFESDVYDNFILNLTNVIGNKSADMAKKQVEHFQTEGSLSDDTKRLLAKVDTHIKLIPEISKFLNNIIGPEGSMKTTYLKCIKSLIDPIVGGELYNPLIDLKQIEQIFAHNYFVAFDNVSEVRPALSNFICAAVSGTSVDFRKLFTSQEIVRLVIKCCVALTSINRAFIERDAGRRSLNQEFIAIEPGKNHYQDETIIATRFEKMKPQLLGYMFSIISKAILIKERIAGKFSLQSMAAAQEWGEAISQAMGYGEGEFIEAYRELDKIQRDHYLDYDPLIIVYSKLCYNLFIKNQGLSHEERKNLPNDEHEALVQGFKEYRYRELISELVSYAEPEGIETKPKNKLWPQNNRELKERSLKLSMQLLNARGYSVDVKHDTHNETLYVVGTKEGLERYRSHDNLGEVDRKQEVVVHECINILQQYDSIEILLEHLLKLASIQNSQVTLYLDNKFKLRESRKVGAILERLLEHLLIEQITESPVTLRWTREKGKEENSSDGSEYSSNTVGEAEETHDNKVMEDSSIQSVAKTPSVFSFEKKFWNKSQNNFQSQTETNSSQKNFSNLKTKPIFATECIEESSTKIGNDSPPLSPPQQVGVDLTQDNTIQEQSRIEDLVPELANFGTFDCEWHKENKKKDDIYCFCLSDNTGHTETFHIDKFGGDRRAFMTIILETMEKYDMLVGYYIFGDRDIDSDLKHLEDNCAKVGLEARFVRLEKTKFLDLYRVFSNRVVEGFLDATYDADYRGYGLDEVVTAYLQNGEGKLDGLSGHNIESEPAEKQIEYCLQDAQLCMKLIQKNDYELLQILYNISKEVNLSFFDTCNSGSTLQWWTSRLRSINYPDDNRDSNWIKSNVTIDKNTGKKKGIKYTGGRVLEPVTGIHFGAKTYDVSSMYPSMSIVHNISSETVNCECCKTDAEAKILPEVMEEINRELDMPRPWGTYWICRKQCGKLSEIMADLLRRKEQYKTLGLTLKEKALKLLMNSGYGTFGQVYFKYYDPRVAELITGFARYTLDSLVKFVNDHGGKILFGDTDSIFVAGDNSDNSDAMDIISEAKKGFNVKLALDRVWKVLFLTSNKKQYVGLTDQGKVVDKGLVGKKNNQPAYFNEVISYLIDQKVLELFLTEGAKIAIGRMLDYVRKAYQILDEKVTTDHDIEFIYSKLAYSGTASKALYNYLDKCWQTEIYNEICADNVRNLELAKSKSQANTVYQYWKINDQKGKKSKVTMHPESHILNIHKYKEELWNCIRPLLEVYGFGANECSIFENEIVSSSKIK